MSRDGLTPSEDQSVALGLMEEGVSILLTGGPGTGKSATIEEFLRRRPATGTVRLASTPSVAQITGGQTVAAFFGLLPGSHRPHDIKVSDQMRCRLHGVRTLIIEGASQIRVDVFQAVRDRLFGCAKGYGPFAGYQLIFEGDFAQLSPRVDEAATKGLRETYGEDAFYAFQSRHWEGLRPVELVTPHRHSADPDLAAWLSALRRAEPIDLDLVNSRVAPAPEGAVHLVASEHRAQEINAGEMARIPGGVYRIRGLRNGAFAPRDLRVPEDLALKPGARVILCADGPRRDYMIGNTGILLGCQRDAAGQPLANVRLDSGKTVTVTQHLWENVDYQTGYRFDDRGNRVPVLARHATGSYLQLPLLPGWAITPERAQGMSIDQIHIADPGIFAAGLAHMALGRVARLAGLTLSAPLSGEMLRVDPRVAAFHAEISARGVTPTRPVACHAGP